MNIRHAVLEDVPGILDIYNDAVLNTTATFDLREQTLEERYAWFQKYGDTYPLLVAEENGHVLGYCSLSAFREKEAYKSTAEISVYVHKDARGKGVARALMQSILELAPAKGFHMIVAGITKGNDISIRLHEDFGFTFAGCLHEAGYKFNEWQDVLFYQLILKS